MTELIHNITATDWSPKLEQIGEIVEDLDDINQCIRVILNTPKGSRAHEPLFGTDLWKYIDHPVNEAIPNIIREAVDAINIWETRIKIVKVVPVIDGSHATLQIEWKLNEDDTVRQTEVVVYGTA